jgi:outer membrane lipoprotein carrier protein
MTAFIACFLTAALGHAPFMTTPAAGSAAVTAATSSMSANDVVDQVQGFYAKINQVTAQFRQTVHNSQFGTDKSSDGMVWLEKPGKMRWDYLDKKASGTQVTKSFISNGTTLFYVEHANKQVTKKSLQNDMMPVAVTFLYGKGNLRTEFDAALDTTSGYGDKGDVVVKLTPKKASAQYKNLFLVVDPTQFRVKESIIVDTSNNVNHFHFYAPDFEKPIKDSWFEFDERSVKNYQVIDGDAPVKPAAPAAPAAPVPLKTTP